MFQNKTIVLACLFCCSALWGIFGLGCSGQASPPDNVSSESTQNICTELREEAVATLAQATNTCSGDDDCGCYNPVHKSFSCGGITDKTTSDKLAAIEVKFHEQKCKWPHQCGAWVCKPKCVSNRCQ